MGTALFPRIHVTLLKGVQEILRANFLASSVGCFLHFVLFFVCCNVDVVCFLVVCWLLAWLLVLLLVLLLCWLLAWMLAWLLGLAVVLAVGLAAVFILSFVLLCWCSLCFYNGFNDVCIVLFFTWFHVDL